MSALANNGVGVGMKIGANHLPKHGVLALLICALLPSVLWAQAGSGTPAHATASNPNPAPNADVSAAPKAHDDTFVIGNDDVLAINVWKEPDVSRSVPVRSDGKIS